MISDEEVLEYSDKNNLLFRNLSNLEKYGSGIEEIIEDIINTYLHKNNKNWCFMLLVEKGNKIIHNCRISDINN